MPLTFYLLALLPPTPSQLGFFPHNGYLLYFASAFLSSIFRTEVPDTVNLVLVMKVEAHSNVARVWNEVSNPFIPPARKGWASGDAEVFLL